ncbi:MAG: hypothetical protein IRY83_14875 [Chloroflexi bacterium]|jgi:hypothetical protein|nr:hypothetical protein [Chloroflexota bacterium]
MGSERTTYLTMAEAWALDDLIRHTWTEEGRPVGRGLLLKVFAVIREFEARRNDPCPPEVLPIALSEDECWAIDYHVRRSYVDPEGYRVGRPLLLKIFGLLLEMRNQEDLDSLRLAENAVDIDSPDVARRLEQWREHLNDEPPENGGDSPPERPQPDD